ncbi:glycerol-3-phosphate dehydrogenase [Flavihumibacter petaseus NBRC 106054]|uniref:Glycerol-3-phosphate dehydrogenase n=2 Tax=Flavihumibacter TaxID=1004301 RepID=A0A0E9MVB9_9BACT|nr:glycerol-3-phosphate dehydrogenase [Flavihumibacter petaseus NBRC 106054]
MLRRLSAEKKWDCIIVGGGATGLGIAVDAASRGYSTLLLEAADFAKGTSSRSTKLVHGGVRYLQQGNVRLVMEALRERGLLRQNAPHLVKDQSFVLPNYKWWEGPFYGIGLKIYDWMAGRLGLGPSTLLSREETLELVPTLDPEGLRGGVVYHDGQFDDARLAINLAQTAVEHGACLINYCRVESLLKRHQKIAGVRITDTLSGETFEPESSCVFNATGVFSDRLRQNDQPGKPTLLALSQGTHLVVDKSFLQSDTAMLIPETSDGRVLFAVPWHQKLLIGTTDIPVAEASAEPIPTAEEIGFLIKNIGRYLSRDPGINDILSVFSGLRPLVRGNGGNTAGLSRDHFIECSDSGLITITGGKWTTYRKMAEDAVNAAIRAELLTDSPCITSTLPVHGALQNTDFTAARYYYGSDREALEQLELVNPELSGMLHPRLPYRHTEIHWAARKEMCMTVEDALSRRTRALLLDARAAIEAAPAVAAILANEHGYPKSWEITQVESFTQTARHYLPPQ